MQHGSIVYEGMSIGQVYARVYLFKQVRRVSPSQPETSLGLSCLKSSQQQHFYLHRNAKQHHKTKSTHIEIKTEQILIQSMYSFH